MVAAFSLTFSQQAIGASTLTPIGDNPTIPASLCGVVYFDANQNGKLDNNEYAISGGDVELIDSSGNKLFAPVNSVGQYSFKNLAPGNYSLYNETKGTWLAVPGAIHGMNQTPFTSLAVGNDWEMDNIVLNAGDQGDMFNFGAQYFPIQLLSKRMLLASSVSGQGGQPFIAAVPEPEMAVILSFAAIAFIIMAARRRCCKK
ncbi:MAG: SdrD B-like domain-containing protein [Thermoguttaceae bacterium]